MMSTPAPQFGAPPLFEPAPPRSMVLDQKPLGVSPDGTARWLVRVSFRDAQGKPTRLRSGGDIEFSASGGVAQWQTRSRFDGPAAIVTTARDGPLAVRVESISPPGLEPQQAFTDTRTWRGARVSAAALGPHAVQLGWFPRAAHPVRIERSGPDGRARTIAIVAPPSSTYRDGSAVPGTPYRYQIGGTGVQTAAVRVNVPPELPATTVDALRGKGMWLSFSPDPRDPDSYANLDPAATVARALAAGLRFLEVRTAYGEFWEITPAAKPAIDALIDSASTHGIALIGWTVPRSTAYNDLSLAYRTAAYRTAAGNGFAGIAVDLERGPEFLGRGAPGRAAIADEIRLLRESLGPQYLLAATVEDPYLAHISEREVPYREIAANSAVVQPMTYWKAMANTSSPSGVGAIIAGSLAALRRAMGRPVPVNIGSQTAGSGNQASLTPYELQASLDAARRNGALGEAFFDWNGTTPDQWEALARYHW